MRIAETDLESFGMGTPWGHTRSWTNHPGYQPSGLNGTGFVVSQLPYLVKDGATENLFVVSNGTTSRRFDYSAGPPVTYTARHYVHDTLTVEVDGTYKLTDSTGQVLVFFGFGEAQVWKRGAFKSLTDPHGGSLHVTEAKAWNSDGNPTLVERAGEIPGIPSIPITEKYEYTYYTSGPSNGLLQNLTLRRIVGLQNEVVRQVDYAYYDGVEPNGNAGNLKTTIIKDDAGAALETKYYRWYAPSEPNGFENGLKYLLSGPSYARMTGAGYTPETATDTDLGKFADYNFEYDGAFRVTKEVVQGLGCSCSGSGGRSTFTYTYSVSNAPFAYNAWKRYTTERQLADDGITPLYENIVYTNGYGQVMLTRFRAPGSSTEWRDYWRFEEDNVKANGSVVLHAGPSAVSGYDEALPDLVGKVGQQYTHLRDDAGRVEKATYYAANDPTAPGYYHESFLQRGDGGASGQTTPIKQHTLTYLPRTGGGITVAVPATETVYRNEDGSGPQVVNHAYTWHGSTVQPASLTVTMPSVGSSQNGPGGMGDQQKTEYDIYGRTVKSVEDVGGVNSELRVEYHEPTGATNKLIVDYGPGRLNLTTSTLVDRLGRPTQITDPNGNLTHLVYRDPQHEVRVYPGWQTAPTNLPTGPTYVYRENWPTTSGTKFYNEALTMTATPNLDASSPPKPTGTESIGSTLQSLTRSYTNDGGQVERSDAYFNITGLTHASTNYLGTQGSVNADGTVSGNYWTTAYQFDDRGRLQKTTAPTGTLTWVDYDVRNRPTALKVGTTDANLVTVRTFAYDGGGVGDGNLTELIQKPAGTATPHALDRKTNFYFDWRNRLVLTKTGVESTEATDVNRPLTYTVFDNLNQATEGEQYDGDTVTVSSTNGVPNRPAANLLRARTTAEYDDQGRVFRAHVYSVDLNNGTVSANSLRTDVWYNRRGFVMKTAQPGGLVTKLTYDGAARGSKVFDTDGRLDTLGTSTSWSEAGNVSDDTVLAQAEYAYDSNNNVTQTTVRERFHDAVGYNELGNPATEPKARVSAAGAYYDRLDRPLFTVNVGTHGGTAWTRPTDPADPLNNRSDTVLRTDYSYDAAGRLLDTTDPRAYVGRRSYDALGRVTQTIDAYTNPPTTSNRTTEYSYDGNGNLLRLRAVLSGGEEITRYLYGVTTTGTDPSDLNSNDLVKEIHHPNKTTGAPDSAEKEVPTYNALGERKTFKDRLSTAHSYSYDVVGRFKADDVTNFGVGVNSTVKKLEVSYDSAGRPQLFTSWSATPAVVNQVRRDYTGLGELAIEYQEHSGAVNISTSPWVGYTYSFDPASGGANHSRLTYLTYPNGRLLSFGYGSAGSLDDTISRLTSIVDGATTLESYTYLGLATVVKRAHPEPNVDLTYIKQTGESNGPQGDPYNGLDLFGRVFDQRWRKGDGTHTDRFYYGYDRNSNRLYRENALNALFSELYYHPNQSSGYDDLDQVIGFKRGELNGTKTDVTTSPLPRGQRWTLDLLGNWSQLVNITNGTETTETRSHNKQNQLTQINSTMLDYWANGNLKTDEAGRTLTYDAWNRVTQVAGSSTLNYAYDALNRRVTESVVSPALTKSLYYSSAWQVLEERHNGAVKMQYVWSPVYVDALVLRDRDADGLGGTLEERLYVQQDANWNVTAVVGYDTLLMTWVAKERYTYDPYGLPTAREPITWVERATLFGWQYLHQGGRYEALVGLYHFRMRDYSPTLGRWVQTDPLGFAAGDSNLYRLLGNNVTNLVDPLGLADQTYLGPNDRGWSPAVASGAVGQYYAGEQIDCVKGMIPRFDHEKGAGGATIGRHYKVLVKLKSGRELETRAWPNGTIWSDEDWDRMGTDNQSAKARVRSRRSWQGKKGRSGFIRGQALASLLGTTVIFAGVGYFYGQAVDVGWNRGLDLTTKVGLARALQLADGMNALPSNRFDLDIGGKMVNIRLFQDRPGQFYIQAWYDGEIDYLIGVKDGYRVYNVNFDTPPSPLRSGAPSCPTHCTQQ